MRDVDALTYPGAFVLGRATVRGVTELWAAVDRVVMWLAGATMRTAMDPRGALAAVGVDVEIRAGIGRSVLLLTLAAALALLAALV
jgi:multicomponent Na+:H+ antiporter subunit D